MHSCKAKQGRTVHRPGQERVFEQLLGNPHVSTASAAVSAAADATRIVNLDRRTVLPRHKELATKT